MHAFTHAFDPFLGPWRGQPAWTRPRRVEHPLLDQVLYERRMVERELAGKERIDALPSAKYSRTRSIPRK